MARTRSRTPKPEASESPSPETLAAADAVLAEALEQRDADPETTIADKFIGLTRLLVEVRKKERLGEATLTKLMEIALNYHAWDFQRRAQEAQQRAFQSMGAGEVTGEAPVGPIPNEYLGEAESDNVVPVDFTSTTEEESS